MPLPEFFGLCGRRNPRPCKIAWASIDSNARIGTYPSDFLPTRRTIWHATTQGGYSFLPPVVSPGETFGLPTVGFFTATGTFSQQSGTFTPNSRFIFSFVRTSNRINVSHILTQDEIDSANLDDETSTGIVDIDVGEFVYEFIAVTDTPEEVSQILTEEEISQLGDLQSESDRIFRKLFEQTFDNNRLVGVKVNKEGIEYRLDNGGPKAVSALEDNGRGFFIGPDAANSYRDGSSRIVQINLKQPAEYSDSTRQPRAGDVVYLTYIAVREHYIRESVNVKWLLAAQTIPPQCFGYPTGLKHAGFRFYHWNVNPDNPNDSPRRVSGWRVVETDNIPVNFTAAMRYSGETFLGDMIIGGGTGLPFLTVAYMPTDVLFSDIQGYIDNRATLPTYNVVFLSGSTGFHLNVGKVGQVTDTYRNSQWFGRQLYSVFNEPIDAQAKVLYNIHPLALLKRDVDKFGIEQSLADQILVDVNSGNPTFFPFMDNPDPLFPNPTIGAKDYVTVSNFKLDPIQPVTKWTTANAEIECGVGGGVALGYQSGFNGFGDVLGAFGINSNIISERFEKDTRVLIEKFITEGQFAPQILAIEGDASPRGSVSCITDRMGLNAFAIHTDNEGSLRFCRYSNEDILESYRHLEYRPDLPAPEIDNDASPIPSQYESLLGYSGMLGDTPGIKPGYSLTCSALLDKSKFKYYTTSFDVLQSAIQNIEADQISFMNIQSGITITIPISTGWHGRLVFRYRNTGQSQNVLVLFKSGSIVGAIDTVTIKTGTDTLDLDFRWIKCDTIEIVGDDLSNVNYSSVFVVSLDDSVADDFLADPLLATRNDGDKNLVRENHFYDKNVLFKTDVMSIGQNVDGKIFVFFNDNDNGISCAQSNDKGRTWVYHYGIVEALGDLPAKNPFVVNSYEKDLAYLFYDLNGKIMCKQIFYKQFLLEDAMLVERYSEDRLEVNEDGIDSVRLGLYSRDGNTIRRDQLSYTAAGDLTDAEFLNLIGKVPEQGLSEPNKDYSVEVSEGEFSIIEKRMNPVAISSTTAFLSSDIEDPFFSVSHSDRGELALWFLGTARDDIGGGQQLQCHFSRDGGISWYDKFEFIENSYNKLRTDKNKKTQFIDWAASGNPVSDIFATDPQEGQQQAFWGINVHWSRLKRHKVDGNSTSYLDASTVLPISSPYAFFHPFLRQIFLFYIYEGCLLCKVFHEGIMEYAAESKRKLASGQTSTDELVGMAYVKKAIEQDERSRFIDGNLNNSDLREELHYYVNTETSERQVEGNIIFPFVNGLSVFGEERTITAQRICAYRYSQCNLRVFYKLERSNDLKVATWNGSNWFVEELMKNVGMAPPEIPVRNVIDVTGGFGSSGYGPVGDSNV